MNNNYNYTSNFQYSPQERERAKLLTLTAFLIGYSLTDVLNSTEQNSVGNFFMLLGQTLCTNAAENFRRGQRTNSELNNNPEDNNNTPEDNNNTIDILRKTQNIFNNEINKLK